jgi:hypothetical protein
MANLELFHLKKSNMKWVEETWVRTKKFKVAE